MKFASDLFVAIIVVVVMLLLSLLLPAHAGEPGLKAPEDHWGAIYQGRGFTLHLDKKACPVNLLALVPIALKVDTPWQHAIEVLGNGKVHEACWAVDYSDATVAIITAEKNFGWVNMTEFKPDPGI